MTINPLLNEYYGTLEPGARLIDGQIIKLIIAELGEGAISTINIIPNAGITGSVSYLDLTASITLSLGAISPSSIVASGTIAGSNLSGTNTGDQTIILTGDVTGAGTGSFATTIASGAVSLSKMANLAANSIVGNNTGSPATPIALTAAQTKTLLSLNNVENTALSTWAGSTNLTTLGTISAGTWNGGVVAGLYGGTGVANSGKTITLGGNLTTSGANNVTFTTSGSTNVTLPTSGTLVNTTSASIAFTGGSITGATWDNGNIGATTPCQIQGFCPTNYQTGTTYTSVLGDAGKRISLTNGSAITFTVPPNGSVAYVAETEMILRQGGAGQVTVLPGAGVTINSYGSLTKLAGQYAYATVKLSSTSNTWDLFGTLSA